MTSVTYKLEELRTEQVEPYCKVSLSKVQDLDLLVLKIDGEIDFLTERKISNFLRRGPEFQYRVFLENLDDLRFDEEKDGYVWIGNSNDTKRSNLIVDLTKNTYFGGTSLDFLKKLYELTKMDNHAFGVVGNNNLKTIFDFARVNDMKLYNSLDQAIDSMTSVKA